MGIRNSLIALLILTGCVRQDPVANAVKAAHASLADIETTVAESCMTPQLQRKFDILRHDIEAVELACDTEADKLKVRLSDWKAATFLLAIALALVLWLK